MKNLWGVIPTRLLHKGRVNPIKVWAIYYSMGGALCPPPNFVISSSIMIKFGLLIEFDRFSPNTAELWRHLLSQATISFEISKFFISDRIWAEIWLWGQNPGCWFRIWSDILNHRQTSSRYWPFPVILPLKKRQTIFNNRVVMATIKVTDKQNLYFWMLHT